MRARGGPVHDLRLRLVNRERVVVASKSFRSLTGKRILRLALRRVPPRGVYALSLRGSAANGAPVGVDVRLRIVRR
jgi:hypothetical protein